MGIVIDGESLRIMQEHALKTYPYECCGALLGLDGEVKEALPLQNVEEENPRRRFQIDPKDFMYIENRARELRLQLLGIYHSHPDHPARPSDFDLSMAWEGLSYVILSVSEGKVEDVRSFRLKKGGGGFVEEDIQFKT